MRTSRTGQPPLVVGVDGSVSCFEAVDLAIDEAVRHHLPLRLLYASRWERYEGVKPAFGMDKPTAELLGDHVTAAAAERVRSRAPQLVVSTDSLAQDPVHALVAAGRDAFAVVVGARGAGPVAELLLGSVSMAVAGHAPCPVIVVRGGERNRSGGFGRVVLGVGRPRTDADVVRFACREAAARGAELHALRAWRRPPVDLAGEAGRLPEEPSEHQRRAERELGEALHLPEGDFGHVPERRVTVEGHSRTALLDAGRTADLLVVGARRVPAYRGLQLGRLAHALLHYAPCPVAIVPHSP
ncbi:universal stress protein [Streptomyces sp. NPDC018031]|uniref:universal stress protein n=1 Tax=Streptomyces sp. NPDC018031 TaxID=3365033 RepID=UPI0037B8C7A0